MRRLAIGIGSSIGIMCALLGHCHGQGLEGVRTLPMGGQLGADTVIQVQGKVEPWPPGIWSSHANISAKPSETAGQMTLSVSSDSPKGRSFIRFFNDQSASPLLPILLSEPPVAAEIEPNDVFRKPQLVQVHGDAWIVDGVLQKSGDVDHYGLAMKQGERWWIAVDAHRSLRSPMDACLQILDASGNILEQNLDRFGLDPAIVWNCPRDGTYIVRVFAFPETPDSTIGYAGGEAFRYRLQGIRSEGPLWNLLARNDTTSGFEDMEMVLVASEPIDRSSSLVIQANSPASRWMVSGIFDSQGDEDAISIETTQPGHWKLQVRAIEIGSNADVVMELLDANGKSIGKQGVSGEIKDPIMLDQMQAPGKYTVVLSDLHRGFGSQHVYLLELTDEQPLVNGTLAKDVFIGEVGKPIELEVTLDRTLGCTDEATIRLEGLPDGASCEPVVSRSGEDTAKKVVLRVTAAKPCSVPIQVRIEQAGQTESRTARVEPHRQPYLWLIAK